jgi:Ca2+-binding EF-hand superfamily protein
MKATWMVVTTGMMLSISSMLWARPSRIEVNPKPNQHSSFFQRFDSNHDSKVSLEEFKANAPETFRKMDSNHDGKVTKQERVSYYKQQLRIKYRVLWNKLDRNRDSKLSREEMPQKLRTSWMNADSNKDYLVSFDEFETWMVHQHIKRQENSGKRGVKIPQVMTLSQFLQFRETQFRLLDKNGDGVVTKNELPAPAKRVV